MIRAGYRGYTKGSLVEDNKFIENAKAASSNADKEDKSTPVNPDNADISFHISTSASVTHTQSSDGSGHKRTLHREPLP